MAEVEDRDNNHHHISSSTTTTSNLPRDLLKRFMAANHHHHRHNHHNLPLPVVKLEQPDHADPEEELELSLGLSMNGRFGVDPTAKKIKRTSSIPEFANPVRDEEMMGGYVVPAVACAPLIRTCSLPTETEEEWRKRKELQTLRRMEARRKRNEKQRNLKALRERNIRGSSEEVGFVEGDNNNHNLVEQQQHGGAGALILNEVNNYNTLRRTTSLTTRVGGLGLNGDKEKEKGYGGLLAAPAPPSPPHGSIGSSQGQGTGSSGTSESESQHGQGPTPMDTRSPTGASLLPDEQKSPVTQGEARVAENSGKIAVATMGNENNKQHSAPQNRPKDIVRNLLEDMPSVSTKGEGPNGKRIEGFLYRYGKGEEVRILCVCHGSFLTPAEFVKHAGGVDVANPLKHIVVSPSFL